MSYRADKQVIDTHTDTHTDRYTDRGNDNTRRPKLASGKKRLRYNIKISAHFPQINPYTMHTLRDPKPFWKCLTVLKFDSLYNSNLVWNYMIQSTRKI